MNTPLLLSKRDTMMAQLVIEDAQLIQALTEIAKRQERTVESVVEDVLREFAATEKAENRSNIPTGS